MGIAHLDKVPNAYQFSRLLKKLSSAPGLELLAAMFRAQVGSLAAQLPQLGQHLAVDATAVPAYSNEMRKAKSPVPWSVPHPATSRMAASTPPEKSRYAIEKRMFHPCRSQVISLPISS